MELFLKQTGGVAGLRLEGSISTSELSEDLASRLEKTLQSGDFLEAQRASKNELFTDARTYELTVLPEFDDFTGQQFTFSENQDIPEILDLLDELLREIIQKKRSQFNNSDFSE